MRLMSPRREGSQAQGNVNCRSLTRQGEIERSAFIQPGLSPDASPMAMHNSLDNGQTHPGSFELLLAVQPLENTEEFIGVFHVKPRAVVFDKINPLIPLLPPTHFDYRLFIRASEFAGIGQKVDKDLFEQRGITRYRAVHRPEAQPIC